MRLLYVVHRYYPFPGGSEYYVREMAEESLRRGHDVTVLAHDHKGDQNGVRVSNDYQTILNERWDLIIVHGGDVVSQNVVHQYSDQIQSPILYLIVKPSESEICLKGLHDSRFLGYSTTMDMDHIRKHGVESKGRRVRHGINIDTTIVPRNSRPTEKVFVSAGGFWAHKGMSPLAYEFTKANIPNMKLHLYGYGEQHLMPADSHNVKCFFGKEKEEVMQAISNSDGYIMNSTEEGFGLVLLESMMNKVPWFAKDIAGAHDMCYYGTLYKDEKELLRLLRKYVPDNKKIKNAYEYVMANHTIQDTVNDIEDVLLETLG